MYTTCYRTIYGIETPKADTDDWRQELVKADKQLTPITKDMFKNEDVYEPQKETKYLAECPVLPFKPVLFIKFIYVTIIFHKLCVHQFA